MTVPTPRRPPLRPAAREPCLCAPAPALSVKAVGSFLPGLTARAFEKYGFSTASWSWTGRPSSARSWPPVTAPERLKWPPRRERPTPAPSRPAGAAAPGATLVLRVEGARALDVQYKRRQIMERINAYFGYAAVTELRIVQAPLPAPCRAPGRACAQRQPGSRCPEVAGIADAGLREALARLGAASAQRPLAPAAPPHADLPYLLAEPMLSGECAAARRWQPCSAPDARGRASNA